MHQGTEDGFTVSGGSSNSFTNNTATGNEGDGFNLSNTNDNTLTDNTASFNSENGFRLDNTVNTTLQGNEAEDNSGAGFLVQDSTDVNLTDNTATGNWQGLLIEDSSDITLEQNDLSHNSYYGLNISESGQLTLHDNTMNNNKYNFKVDGTTDDSFYHDIDTSNTVDGKQIHYLTNTSDVNIDSASDAGTVYCINCTNVSISDVTLSSNGYGVNIRNSTNVSINNINSESNEMAGVSFTSVEETTLSNSTISDNDGFGILVDDNQGLTVLSGNTVSNNNGGILLKDSDNLIIKDSHIEDNENFGLGLDNSTGNNIYNNYFMNENNTMFSGQTLGNTWNITETDEENIIGLTAQGGNFWGQPDGNGFSQLNYAPDSRGILNESYPLDNGDVDYLPLAFEYPTPTPTPTPTPVPTFQPGPNPSERPKIPDFKSDFGIDDPAKSGMYDYYSQFNQPWTAKRATLCEACNGTNLSLSVMNTGTKAWTYDDRIALFALEDALWFGKEYYELPAGVIVMPGEIYDFDVFIRNCTPGNYTPRYQMGRLFQKNPLVRTLFGEQYSMGFEITNDCGNIEQYYVDPPSIDLYINEDLRALLFAR